MEKITDNIIEFPVKIKLLKSASDLMKYLSKDTQNEVIEKIRDSSTFIKKNLYTIPEKFLFEYSTPIDSIYYGYVAFWDRSKDVNFVVIASHGFFRNGDKIPEEKKEMIFNFMIDYFNRKKV
jgi:hypothetical protein